MQVSCKMANAAVSSESSDGEEFEESAVERGLQGYLYEPQRICSASGSESETEDLSHSEPEDDRTGTDTWCKCGKCHHELLVRDKEHVCCFETNARRLSQDSLNGELLSFSNTYHVPEL